MMCFWLPVLVRLQVLVGGTPPQCNSLGRPSWAMCPHSAHTGVRPALRALCEYRPPLLLALCVCVHTA